MPKSKITKKAESLSNDKKPATKKVARDVGKSKIEISKREKKLRFVLSCVFFIFTAWLVAPVVSSIAHEGMFFALPSGIGFLLSASPELYALVFKKSKVFARIFIVLIIIGCAVLLVILSLLIYGGTRTSKQGCTVIVLGCAVNGEQPSLMLQRRIEVAYEYALENPDSAIIATGGQGLNEDISEGECIKRTLINLGIEPERIYVEDTSINTMENLQNAAEIIEREGLNKEVVLATSRFHQYRASLNATKAGLTSYPLSCGTLIWLAPGYWLREVIGLLRWIFLGY